MNVRIIKTAEEYDVGMARMAELMDAELAPGSAEELEFELLALVIQAYESTIVPPVKAEQSAEALREERMKVKPINTEKEYKADTITIKPNAWQMYTQVGWVCPVCGAGNAPTTTSCGCKSSTKGTALPTRKAVKVKPINTEKEYKAAIARTTELLAAEPKSGWSEDDEELKLLYREMQDYELRRSDVAPASVMKRLGLWWKKHFVVNNEH